MSTSEQNQRAFPPLPRASAPAGLRFEHHEPGRPLVGIGVASPRLSWQVPGADPGFHQSAYEVEISLDGASPKVFRVESSDQVLVPWPAQPLASRQVATVRVRLRGSRRSPGTGTSADPSDSAGLSDWNDWSEAATVEAGLLSKDDWKASFITPSTIGKIGQPAPVMSGNLFLDDSPARARLYISAHGAYLAAINGQRVGDEVLAPGWSAYHKRLRYQSFDVTDMLHAGDNLLDVLLGNGWYRGRLGFKGERALYGERLAVIAQLEVMTAEDKRYLLATDRNWRARESSLLADDIYDGQRTDLRLPLFGERTQPGVEVELTEDSVDRLVAPDGPPVRVTEIVPAVRVWESPSGATLVDFGQNLVGWVRLRVRNLPSGSEVVVRHAEVLEGGELGTRPLRSARATDGYIVAGTSEEILEPTFTFHGFRYAEVSGVGSLDVADVEAMVIGSDMRRTGWFSSSHPQLNRFHDNVVWSMRGNFVDVPTDCPQRDERLGWTGDLQVFSPTATFLFDCTGLLTSWLADLACEQRDDGTVPFVIPNVLGETRPAAAWGDAATVVPWVLYQRSGDVGILARQLPSMCRWVDRLSELAGADHLWSGGFQFGDWLDPSAPPNDPFRARADPDVVATAHLARSAEIVALAATVLGEVDKAQHYAEIATAVREAFSRHYVTPAGRVVSEAETVYSLALAWELLAEECQRSLAGRRLADLVRSCGFRIGTGFVGTPVVADALASGGQVDTAYRLLLQTGCPSWLYPVTMGATTIWERWDSMLPDGSINPGEMTSFNHYALGAVADWLHRSVAGLAPAEPGYREILVRPLLGGGLESAAARHLTPYGTAAVGWERGEGMLRLSVEVPVGANATVYVPGGEGPVRVGHGHHAWEVSDPVSSSTPSTTTVRDVFDQPQRWQRLLTVAVEAGLALDEADLARRLSPYLDSPACEIRPALVGEFAPGAEALGSRLDSILAP